MAEAVDNKKCYSCNVTFKTMQALTRHKNRATPCLIREVPPEHVANPNRCIYCNKVLSKKEHLTRHLKNCKVKNGGMDMLVDKVRYDQEIRILKEQRENDKIAADERDAKMVEMRKELDQLKNQLKNQQIVPAGTVNNIVNNTFNAPVAVTIINNYKTPDVTNLRITVDDLGKTMGLAKFLLQQMYFNPDLPQNHCIYLQNKKDKTLVVYSDNAWNVVLGDNINDVIDALNGSLYHIGSELLNGKLGPYGGTDKQFATLPGGYQHKLIEFNGKCARLITNADAYEVFLAGRDVVLNTIKAAGCKLV